MMAENGLFSPPHVWTCLGPGAKLGSIFGGGITFPISFAQFNTFGMDIKKTPKKNSASRAVFLQKPFTGFLQ